MSAERDHAAGPRAGLKVVQVASMAPAPFGCMVLADLGFDAEAVADLRARGVAG